LASGGQGTFQVSLTPAGGFSGTAQVQIAGLPGNATIVPTTSFSLSADSPQTVSVGSSTLLGSGSYSLTVTATSGSIVASATEALSVQNYSPPSRADFIGTYNRPSGAAYDQVHQRVYFSNPAAGSVDVISSTTYQILRRIPVSLPAGVDISPDDSTVFIGTSLGVMYALDTATLSLTSRYIAPIETCDGAPCVATPMNPVATPDGNVEVTTESAVVKWNPSTGSVITVMEKPEVYFGQYPPFDFLYPIAHSADHSKLIVGNGNNAVSIYDLNQNAFTASASFSGILSSNIASVAANPNGTQFAITDGSNIEILDANLNVIGTIPGGGYLLYSLDGSTLYLDCVTGSSYSPIPVFALFDMATMQQIGTSPSYAVDIADQDPSTDYETPMVADETGRIFSTVVQGLAINDTTDLRSYTGAEIYPIDLMSVWPNAGALNQQETVGLGADPDSTAWFGSLPAQTTSSGQYLSVTAPASANVGPVNIRIEDDQGVQSWQPFGFSYGTLLPPQPDIAASSAGGTKVEVFGYGLGTFVTSKNASMSFGGQAGTVTSNVSPGNGQYNSTNLAADWYMSVQTPQMALGESDLTATYYGNSTLPNAYHAVSIDSYTLDGTPYSMAYDAGRDRVYVAVTDHVDAFSLSTNAFVSTIEIPTVNGNKQLAGMALTPDGKWLIVANWADYSVAVIDPDNPSSATAISLGATPYKLWGEDTMGPFQVAPTSNDQSFITLSTLPNSLPGSLMAGGPLFLLDPESLTISEAPSADQQLAGSFFLSSSPDGSAVCSAGPYALYVSATGTITSAPIPSTDVFECAVDAGVVTTGDTPGRPNNSGYDTVWPDSPYNWSTIRDLSMHELSTGSLLSWQFEELGAGGWPDVLGVAVHHTGALTYLLGSDGIALIDVHTGEYREKIMFPTLSQYLAPGSLVIDQTGEQIFVVLQGGFTKIQLDSLPLAIGNITDSEGTWTITGTGFVSGTAITVDGASQSVAYTDSQRLTVSGPPALGAAHLITLTNPDGHAYTYDAAFLR
jgi:hypothetical protein